MTTDLATVQTLLNQDDGPGALALCREWVAAEPERAGAPAHLHPLGGTVEALRPPLVRARARLRGPRRMMASGAAMPVWARLSLRILLVVVGGYLLAAGVSGLAAAALSAVMPKAEAVILMAMLVFLVYLVLLLWGFAEGRSARLWAVFGGGGVAAFALAQAIGATGVI